MKNKWLLLILVIGLSGCYPKFKQAVVDPEHNKLDKRLFGMWEMDKSLRDLDKDQYGFLLFLPCENRLCITFYTSANDEESDVVNFQGFASEIDGKGYINYKEVGTGEKEDYYELAAYQITEDRKLKLSLVDTKKLDKAVIEKKITGEVADPQNTSGISSSTVVTATQEELMRFLGTTDIFREEKQVFNYKDFGLPRK